MSAESIRSTKMDKAFSAVNCQRHKLKALYMDSTAMSTIWRWHNRHFCSDFPAFTCQTPAVSFSSEHKSGHCVDERADTATDILAAFALICLWCHLFPPSHLWLADCSSICSVSWLGLLAQGGGLSEALWIMAGCPDNPCNVDSLPESNMAVHSNGEHDHYKRSVSFIITLVTAHGGFWSFWNKLQSYFLRNPRNKCFRNAQSGLCCGMK